LCFGTLLRDWVTCEIWWQTSDMRPMIMSTIGGYCRLHKKHDQTWHYKICSQFHLFYHATFSSLFQNLLWLVTINCRHKQFSIFFIMIMDFLFGPLQENVINFGHSTKHSPSFPILSFHKFWDHSKQ
jgi:hypothetical protein